MLKRSTPSNQVVAGARVVATVSSSVGPEAALLGRPTSSSRRRFEPRTDARKVVVLSDLPALLRELADAYSPDVLACSASNRDLP